MRRHQVDDGLHLNCLLRHQRLAPGAVVQLDDGVVHRGQDAPGEQHQRLVQHIAQQRAGLQRQRVLLRQRQHQGFTLQRQAREAGRHGVWRVQQKAGVHLTAFQRLQLQVAGRLDQFQRNARMLQAERTHPARQQRVAHGGDKAQAQAPQFASRCRACLQGQRGGTRQQRLRLGQQRRTGRRQAHRALGAIEQPQVQLTLQRGNRLGQRGLRHVQTQRGATKMQVLGDRHKLLPHAQFDDALASGYGITHTPIILKRSEKYIGK